VHARVTLPYPGGGRLDLCAVGDVADLGLGVDLRGDLLQALRAAREEDAAPAAGCQEPRGGGSDPARPSCDDGDPYLRSVVPVR
jgi:hypothetical protein